MPTPITSTVPRQEHHATEAGESLLESKISQPHLPGWTIFRERVAKLIADGVQGPLTVITGPPGAGKTMALASWSAAGTVPWPVAWLSVDRYDSQPETIWCYLVETLRRAGVAIPPAARAWDHKESTRRGFLRQLASALAAQSAPVVLVLDDLHLLTKPAPLEDLDYVLHHASGGLRLVTASRMDPLLPLHRFRLTGDLAEIRARDLAFSVSEARMLMEQHGITLSPAAIETITERGEGWPAGLRLAALSMRGHPDPDQFAKEFGADDSSILSYLGGEVLDNQPARTRDLLLKTSILDRVNDELAGELTDNRHSAGSLSALAETNAFIEPLGQGWYRYHSVFADVLRLKMRRDSRYDVPELHRRAVGWFRRNGRLADAISQAATAAHWELAARTVVDELAIGRLIQPRAGDAVAKDFRHMPPAPAPAHPPTALVAAAMAVRDCRGEMADTLLHTADGLLGRLPTGEEVPSRLAAAQIRFAVARRSGDLNLAEDAVAQEESLLGKVPEGLLARHPEARVELLSSQGVVDLWRGRFDSASARLLAAAACEGADDGACPAGLLALLEVARGRPLHAEQLAAEVIPSADDKAALPGSSAAAAVALAWARLEHVRLGASRRQLERARDALRASPDRLVAAVAYLVAARQCLATGRRDAAAEMIDRARRGWSPPPWLAHRLLLAESHARAAGGDSRIMPWDARDGEPGTVPEASIAFARCSLAAGNPQAAGEALAAALPADAAGLPSDIALEACLVDAALRYRTGDHESGRRSLEQALQLAQPEQLRLPFKLEKPWLEPVVARDPGLARAFRRLLEPATNTVGDATPARVTPRPIRATPAGQGAPVIVEQLTTREREVLQRASALRTTNEIAAELYVSTNTIKSHFRSISRKLGATGRREAVRRARELQLL